MTTYCDYCYSRDHQRWSCPSLRATEADADDASLEELEAAASIYDLTIKEQSIVDDDLRSRYSDD